MFRLLLIASMLFVLGLPGLRAVAWRGAALLNGCNHSALSHAVRRPSSVRMVQALLDALAPRGTGAVFGRIACLLVFGATAVFA